ncbi:MAG: hypothetical protein PHC62_01240 [Candidatus Izemoplasmatales bacterium]|jgi:hypothetical protein|nr:hypothetical protein [Candidatus Izemoplasmatales bacterium]
MDFVFILFISLFSLSILAIIFAFIIISHNIRVRKYIDSHKEKALVLRKDIKNTELSNVDKNSKHRFIKYFLVVQLANSSVLTFEISEKQFSSVLTGETAILAFRGEKLLFYESKHKISTVFLDQLTDRYPFYHRQKQGPQVLFYANFPSINIIINSYESISLDYSEIKEAFSLIKKIPEEFFCLVNKDDDSLEIICVENQFEIQMTLGSNLFTTFVEEEKNLLDLIGLWMNEKHIIDDYKFTQV